MNQVPRTLLRASRVPATTTMTMQTRTMSYNVLDQISTRLTKIPNAKAQGIQHFQKFGVGNAAHPTYSKGPKDKTLLTGAAGVFGTVFLVAVYGLLHDLRGGNNKIGE